MCSISPMQKAIIYGSVMGSILNEYSHKEQTKAINQIRADIRKMMSSRSRTNYKELHGAIMIADRAWKRAIDHFAAKNISIEAIRTTANLYAAAPEELKRFANITQKKIDALERSADHSTSLDVEMSSHEVSDYIIGAVNEAIGAGKKESKLSGMKRKAETMANLKRMEAECGL